MSRTFYLKTTSIGPAFLIPRFIGPPISSPAFSLDPSDSVATAGVSTVLPCTANKLQVHVVVKVNGLSKGAFVAMIGIPQLG